MVKSKSFWSDQNHFGHIEGQGIRVKACLFEKDRNFLNISLSIGKKTEKNDISYTAKSTCDSSIRLQSYSKAFSTVFIAGLL